MLSVDDRCPIEKLSFENSDRIIIDAVVIIDSEIFQYKQKREHDDDDGPKEYGCEHEYKR